MPSITRRPFLAALPLASELAYTTRWAGDDRIMARPTFLRVMDPVRIVVAGFSDGASYSLSMGLANGDWFTPVPGFSPGIFAPGQRKGKPPIFISRRTQGEVLRINECSRRIAPRLKGEGYEVTYRDSTVPHAPSRGRVGQCDG